MYNPKRGARRQLSGAARPLDDAPSFPRRSQSWNALWPDERRDEEDGMQQMQVQFSCEQLLRMMDSSW